MRSLLKKIFKPFINRFVNSSDKVQRLEKIIDFIGRGEQNMWLYANSLERMDATVDIFDKLRRDFHLARYEFACDYVKGKVTADIASGTGYGTECLLKQGGAAQVTGVDIDPKAVEYAELMHNDEKIQYVCTTGDDTKMPQESFDAVVSFETIEHVPDDKTLVKEFHRLLKPDGILVISTPNDWPIDDTPYHVRAYDKKSFEDTLSTYFDKIELFNQNSGSPTPYNHKQPAGIWPTTPENEHLAECYIAVCTGRKPL